ncbi:MAG: hypothetical protein JST54_03160 [Deltaproteobacteria bacterium]|nr:hypothetical protein [Deltaproteobacteria bacterium]
MLLRVELGLDHEGKWVAEMIDVPGCVGHGFSPRAAIAEALELAADAYGLGLREDLQFEFNARGHARQAGARAKRH